MKWAIGMLALSAAAFALLVSSCSSSSAEPSMIMIERLMIVDSAGRQRIILDVGDDGEARVKMLSEDGHPRLTLLADEARSEVVLAPIDEFAWKLALEEDPHGSRIRIGEKDGDSAITLGI